MTGWVFSGIVVLFVTYGAAHAQTPYPTRTIRIIIPTAPGGGNDITGRMLAQGYPERFGVPAVPENRTGAGTVIGNDIVAKSKPDGYTLLLAPGALAITPTMYRKMPYDAARDFAPITQAATVPTLITLHPSVPAKSVKELIALARARPGEFFYASAGHGTQPHLTMELFASMAKIRMVHVAYKGTTPGLTDLLEETIAILRTTQNRERLAADGAEVVGSTPEAFAAFYQAELLKWANVVKDAGIKPE